MASRQTSENNEGAKLAAYCPVCDARFSTRRTKSIAKDAETELYYGTCHRCSQHVLSLVMNNQQGVSSVGLITDLSEQDVGRMRSARPLSTDDVLVAHQWFSAFRMPVDGSQTTFSLIGGSTSMTTQPLKKEKEPRITGKRASRNVRQNRKDRVRRRPRSKRGSV